MLFFIAAWILIGHVGLNQQFNLFNNKDKQEIKRLRIIVRIEEVQTKTRGLLKAVVTRGNYVYEPHHEFLGEGDGSPPPKMRKNLLKPIQFYAKTIAKYKENGFTIDFYPSTAVCQSIGKYVGGVMTKKVMPRKYINIVLDICEDQGSTN